jgi:hypothetical protein
MPHAPSDVTAMIKAFAKGPELVREAYAGLSASHLDAFPVPGTWSLRQIAVHILDSDLAATHRMRRIACEETPLLIAYDETAFARSLSYEREDLGMVLDLFALNRRFTAGWLSRVPQEVFERVGVHNQRGKVSLAEMVGMYVKHVDHHLVFVRKKRAMLGA